MNKFKVESGMQMLARLIKKPLIDNFYPNIFKSGPKPGHIIEIYSNEDISCILSEIICELLLPLELGGKEAGVVIFNTDGRLNFDNLAKLLQRNINTRTGDAVKNNYLESSLSNLFIFDIYNATQFHATIHTLESFLINHSNVSLLLFDTLTAFYWSEQGLKIVKMDSYIKSLIRMIQNVVKDYKVVVIYTRPEYFSSTKECIENLEACSELRTSEHLNYRIQVVFSDEGLHYADVRTFTEHYKKFFKLLNNSVQWL